MRSHPAISLAVSASLAVGGGAAPVAAADGGQVTIQVGQAQGFSHIAFTGVLPSSAHREGDDLVLQFGAIEPPNLSLLRVAPPQYMSGAETRETPAGLQLRLKLDHGVEAKLGRADGGAYVNLFPGADTPAPPDQPAQRTSDPTPASGVVKAHAGLDHGVLSLRFDWRAPVGAAVFRRGEAVWVVFDAKARLDLSELPDGLPQARRAQVVASRSGAALRIEAPQGVLAAAVADGASWTVSLGPSAGTPPAPVTVKSQGSGLAAQLPGATSVLWIDDPSTGDRLAVVPALGPGKGVLVPRQLVDVQVLSSAQGLALAPLRQDLQISSDGDVVRINRPSGLALSEGVQSGPIVRPAADLPQPGPTPAFVDFDGWSRTGEGGFLPRYNALLQAASSEGAQGKGASTQARFGFARFLVGSELAFEAIGVLDLMAKTDSRLLSTPEFRGLRGAARVLAGRYRDAQADFSSPAVMDDPSAALWRGYAASRLGDGAGARQAFAAGASALPRFAPRWRERFMDAAGEAALATADVGAARAWLNGAQTLKPTGVDQDRLQLDLGRLAETSGQPQAALPFYANAEASRYGGVAARALLAATEVQESLGKISRDQAAQTLSSVGFRWRGDEVELEAARALGRLYIAQGRYRDGLQALKAVQNVSPQLPASAAIQADLTTAFRSLFIDGGADGMAPLQALALFTDFKELTPIGTDGDAMVRKLARRLVDVDLLDQAADLLKYQADNRLDGVARADVDTELALIQVMNRRPEQALDALNASRTTLLPSAMQSQRRVIQSRALTALGRYDDALEILADDKSADAGAARAEIAWSRHDWPQAGRLLEVALGARYKSATPLSDLEQTQLLRAAIAYSLAGDDAGLGRLRTRYAGFVSAVRTPDMLRVALSGVSTGFAAPDYAKAASETDEFAAWVAAMKSRLLTAPQAAA